MKPVFWLASYPKSGNTWLRMLLNALAAGVDGALDINALTEKGGVAAGREGFERITLIESDLLTHDEIDRLRPQIHEALARAAPDGEDDDSGLLPTRFVKAHDAYLQAPGGEALLAGARAADGAILIVRDPRAVAPSLAHHFGVSVDTAIGFMGERNFTLCGGTRLRHPQLRQRLGDWSAHAASWLEQTDLPLLLLRYEDMCADTAGVLRRALDFSRVAAAPEEIRRAIDKAHFSELRRQEAEQGFREAEKNGERAFFRRGEANAWREELTPEQAARIETAHGDMMRRLGYELSAA